MNRTAVLNFAAERRQDYASSNFRPEWTTLKTVPHAVELHDARDLPVPPRLDREGFELHRLPVADPQWEDNDWVQSVYIPLARELVLAITGGACALTFPGSWVIRDTGRTGFAPAAQYVHMDREYGNCRLIVRNHFGEDVLRRYSRFEVVNVWRSLTPPPQDHPLALCDQRSVDRSDWAICETLEPNLKEPMAHTVSVHNPDNRWFWFSDMTPDEAIVFLNYNDDEHGPPACPHTAFHDPSARNAAPRASFELRFYVFYEG